MNNVALLRYGRKLFYTYRDAFKHHAFLMDRIQYGSLNIKKGDIVIDAGAFTGGFAIWASGLVGPYGRIIAIEPHPHHFKILKANVLINRLHNVILINKAISDREGKVSLTGAGPGAHISNMGGFEVKTTTLDKILKEHNLAKADILKMDIEGSEIRALKTFQKLQDAREVAVEAHGARSLHYVVNCLNKMGFRISVLDSSMLIRNIIKQPSMLPFLTLAELKSRFWQSRLWLKYFLGFENHPVPACRDPNLKLILARKAY